MAITVGDIYTAFPSFNPKDMIELVGNEDFNGRTQIKLSNIANYQGGMAQELSIFTAKKEGKDFVNMLAEGKRADVSEAAGIKEKNDFADNKTKGQNVPSQIPMDRSIFDIQKENEGIA